MWIRKRKSGSGYWTRWGLWHWQTGPTTTACNLQIKDTLWDWQYPWQSHREMALEDPQCKRCQKWGKR